MLEAAIPAETARRLAEAEAGAGSDPGERGAVWTYLTQRNKISGAWTTRVPRGLRRKLKT